MRCFNAFPTLDLDPLARFQRLVEFEEMTNLLKRDFRQVLVGLYMW